MPAHGSRCEEVLGDLEPRVVLYNIHLPVHYILFGRTRHDGLRLTHRAIDRRTRCCDHENVALVTLLARRALPCAILG
eukprot:scaffold247538_cov32-Tisochrysis_lutea.AAC.4